MVLANTTRSHGLLLIQSSKYNYNHYNYITVLTEHVTDGWNNVHKRESRVHLDLSVFPLIQVDHYGDGKCLVTKLELVLCG